MIGTFVPVKGYQGEDAAADTLTIDSVILHPGNHRRGLNPE
jgi:hypothetical protein